MTVSWTAKEDDERILMRPMCGPEALFHRFIAGEPTFHLDVIGTLYLDLIEEVGVAHLREAVQAAWISLRAEHPILGVKSLPDFQFEHQDIEDEGSIRQWAEQSLSFHSLGQADDQVNLQQGSVYNQSLTHGLPDERGNFSKLTVLTCDQSTVKRVAFSLHMVHSLIDAGCIAILLSDLRKLLAAPAKKAEWGSKPFRLYQRSRLPVPLSQMAEAGLLAEGTYSLKKVVAGMPLSKRVPHFADRAVEEPYGGITGHLVQKFTAEESTKLRTIARENGLTFTALVHAVIALRAGKELIVASPNETTTWYAHFPVDCRAALIDKRWPGLAMSVEFVAMHHYAAALDTFSKGDTRQATVDLGREAMQTYGKLRKDEYRAALADQVDDIFGEFGKNVASGEYAPAKMPVHFFSDSMLESRYIQDDVPSLEGGGIATGILDYDTTLFENFQPALYFRSHYFRGRTYLSLDWAPKYWPRSVVSRLFEQVMHDLRSFL